jgi:non-heme chloroperoxidase
LESYANKEKEMSESISPISRREILIGGGAAMAVAALPFSVAVGQPQPAGASAPQKQARGETCMNRITTKDGVSLFYKDWGTGPTVVFSHGWPLNADAWDAQMLFLGQQGYRVVAHDRRGHGRSEQTWTGNEYDAFADDLAELLEKLDLKDVTLVGHSMGGGEVTRYIGRHGNERVKKVVIIGGIPPVMLKSDKNPGGLPMSVFDGIRAGLVADRSQFYKDVSAPFYGADKPDAKVSQGVRDMFWLQGMQSSVVASYECVKAFSETDFTDDLKKIDVPTLIIHGDADQIVPIGDSAYLSSKIVKNATLKVFPGAPHGLCTTHADQINAELLAFLKA